MRLELWIHIGKFLGKQSYNIRSGGTMIPRQYFPKLVQDTLEEMGAKLFTTSVVLFDNIKDSSMYCLYVTSSLPLPFA